MVVYNFKKIVVVQAANDMIDVVLSRTMRKTPTVIRRHYEISRIRAFYMRKVKFTQQTFHDKLTQILTDFPRFDSLHPFYADLLNVLYDRDHYKLALGQLARARTLIDGIAKDYVRLLKFGDSLYRCKQLKRAALGRMCTLIKKHSSSLQYLEQVRQHLARLPSIDPSSRTLLVAGFPNVGKSSFMNKITRADVDVQPYAFTTKQLFVGITDYKYLRYQVIDTPGILDHELEDRNVIEMQSITALAHLRAVVLFFIDPSQQCGYSLEKQYELYKGIAPLLGNKPTIVVANKTDLGWENELEEEEKEILKRFKSLPTSSSASGAKGKDMEEKVPVLKMSARDEDGVMQVKNTACETLLKVRVEAKIRAKKAQGVLNRLHVAEPQGGVNKNRPPVIPPAVLAARAAAGEGNVAVIKTNRRLERDMEEERGGAGVYVSDWRKNWKLKHDDWASDYIPEVVDGKNIADFVDPQIEEKLIALEKEEAAREVAEDAEDQDYVMGYRKITPEEKKLVAKIREERSLHTEQSSREKARRANTSTTGRSRRRPESSRALREHLDGMGMDADDVEDVAEAVIDRVGRKRKRSESVAAEAARSESVARLENLGKRARIERSVSVAPGDGFRDTKEKVKAMKVAKKKMKMGVGKYGKTSVGDRSIPNKKPKHLLSGKRGIGKTDRR